MNKRAQPKIIAMHVNTFSPVKTRRPPTCIMTDTRCIVNAPLGEPHPVRAESTNHSNNRCFFTHKCRALSISSHCRATALVSLSSVQCVTQAKKREKKECMFNMSCPLPSQLSPPRKSKTVPMEMLSKERRRRRGDPIKDRKRGG